MPTTIDGARVNAVFTKRTAVFQNLDIKNNHLSAYGVFYLNKLVNIDLTEITITNNVEIQNPLNDYFLSLFKESGDTYVQQNV